MKWRIKNPSSKDPGWGDHHLGNCLAKYPRRQGQEVVTDFRGGWDRGSDTDADVILGIRGRYPYRVRGSAFHVMWRISRPDQSTDRAMHHD